jgi:hypothetical protein
LIIVVLLYWLLGKLGTAAGRRSAFQGGVPGDLLVGKQGADATAAFEMQ